MTTIYHILDGDLLSEMLAGGFVSRRSHPKYPYFIYNYTPKCTFENKWNDVTMTCRGLIVHAETSEVLARPFRKFFNHRQSGCPKVEADTRVVAYDKLDGSLGILYPEPDGGYAIATRGSFDSPQAIRGTEIWKERHQQGFTPDPKVTPLFEIIYKENRVVLDYGFDDLVFLGGVWVDDGKSLISDATYFNLHARDADRFDYSTFAAALAAPPRKNAEGLVLYLPDTDERIKIKQDDYLAMHKIVCGLNERVVWEALCEGRSCELIAGLPDEFQGWAQEVTDRLVGDIMDKEAELDQEFWNACHSLPNGFSRKDFALKVMASPNKWAMFAMLDGHNVRPELQRRARPEASLCPSNLRCQSEGSN